MLSANSGLSASFATGCGPLCVRLGGPLREVSSDPDEVEVPVEEDDEEELDDDEDELLEDAELLALEL
ncbi:hypothetical protein GCM10009754_49280 [Amycolatopsis minnesotensis]|uniref:Secreted protein n=1 Tax=Amycolatopsis minnesotensis TaxID=337894 RepID=A0ABN2RIM5_9PSEU